MTAVSPKAALRQAYRARCRAILPAYRQQAAMAAAKRFVHEAIFQTSRHIACYLACPHEFATEALIEAIWHAGRICYIPVLSPTDPERLLFVRYDEGDPLHFNRYSILEPVHVDQGIAPQQLDLVITPLIAFDKAGHRLGTGGGYYDKTFAFLTQSEQSKPILMGMGFDCQEAPALPADPWDITLSGVVTEKTFFFESLILLIDWPKSTQSIRVLQ